MAHLDTAAVPSIGIIANPVSGKDIRRLVSNAPTSTLQEKYTIVRRVVVGAAEVGVRRFWFMSEPHRICARAVETLDLDVAYDHVDVPIMFDESDTVRTVAKLAELGCDVVVVLGGDGTNRAAALGWPDLPVVAISTGTNNVFPRSVEATLAGAAAGLVATRQVGLGEVSRNAKVVHVEIDGERDDLALIDAVLLNERFVGSRALFDPAALRLAVLTRAEPASIGVSSIGGLLMPCSADDEAAVLVRFAAFSSAPRRLRAPLAPGLYSDLGIGECVRLGPGEPVDVSGPGILAFDGERHRVLKAGQRARLWVDRSGPRVIDTATALRLAAQRQTFIRSGAPDQPH